MIYQTRNKHFGIMHKIWLHKETVSADKKAIKQNTIPKGRDETFSIM